MKKIFICCVLTIISITFQVKAIETSTKDLGQTREIVFDIETTGLSYKKGDKIVGIGAIELVNNVPTGRTYQQYINPMKKVSQKAFSVHGLSEEFLSQYPTFSEVAQDFLDFIGDESILIAHNGKEFDIPFLNYELKQNGFETLEKHQVIDALDLAKDMFPTEPHDLDYMSQCFNIDNSERIKHDALLDAKILVGVYKGLINETPSKCPSAIIKQAISENKKLKIVYEDGKKEVTRRTIEPKRFEFGSVFNEEGSENEYPLRTDKQYIKAYCELDQDNRTFRLDRIKQIAIVDSQN